MSAVLFVGAGRDQQPAVVEGEAVPRRSEPVSIRYQNAAPGQPPTGLVPRLDALGPVLLAGGVADDETCFSPGDVVLPSRTATERYGHAALDNAGRAAALVVVEVG